jgi:hypothetical protein
VGTLKRIIAWLVVVFIGGPGMVLSSLIDLLSDLDEWLYDKFDRILTWTEE